MTFSDQFIKILDALCEKVGITIDWTSANVLPYLQDLMHRFVKYETYTSILWIIIASIGIAFLLALAYKEAKKQYSQTEIIAFLIVCVMAFGLFAVGQILDIIEVNTLPEKTIIQYVKSLNEQ